MVPLDQEQLRVCGEEAEEEIKLAHEHRIFFCEPPGNPMYEHIQWTFTATEIVGEPLFEKEAECVLMQILTDRANHLSAGTNDKWSAREVNLPIQNTTGHHPELVLEMQQAFGVKIQQARGHHCGQRIQ